VVIRKKFLRDVPGKRTSGLSGIGEVGLLDEGHHEIVDASHNGSGVFHSHPSRIFVEGHIARIMQTGFDVPMGATEAQATFGGGFLTRQAGNANFDLSGSALVVSFAPPLKLTLQAIGLSQTRPGGIVIEHFTRVSIWTPQGEKL